MSEEKGKELNNIQKLHTAIKEGKIDDVGEIIINNPGVLTQQSVNGKNAFDVVFQGHNEENIIKKMISSVPPTDDIQIIADKLLESLEKAGLSIKAPDFYDIGLPKEVAEATLEKFNRKIIDESLKKTEKSCSVSLSDPTPKSIKYLADNLHKSKARNFSFNSAKTQSSINIEDMKVLLDAVKQNENITSLNLSNNYMGNEMAKAVLEQVQQNPNITELRFWDNRMGKESLKATADLIKSDQLVRLELAFNVIGDDEVKDIAAALENNTKLKHLSLDDCSISDKGADALIEALKKNKSLQYLSLSQNQISEEKIKVIEGILKERNQDALSTVSQDGKHTVYTDTTKATQPLVEDTKQVGMDNKSKDKKVSSTKFSTILPKDLLKTLKKGLPVLQKKGKSEFNEILTKNEVNQGDKEKDINEKLKGLKGEKRDKAGLELIKAMRDNPNNNLDLNKIPALFSEEKDRISKDRATKHNSVSIDDITSDKKPLRQSAMDRQRATLKTNNNRTR